MGDDRCGQLCQLAATAPPGCFVEVGVYQGGSAWHLANVARDQGRLLHLFDTFSGHPFADKDDTNKAGDFGDTDAEAVRKAVPDATLYIGVFPDTLPSWLTNIAFVHCDCDQYQSVGSVIDELWPRMVAGGIMAFDDMDTHGGEKAIRETFGDTLGLSHGWYCVRKPA
jgi:O-methyltransferase